MIKYFYNFWVWWYFAKAYDIATSLMNRWLFIYNYMNLPSMIENFIVPLYQDQSGVGKFISVIIRSVWIILGGVIMLLLTVPMIIIFGIYLLLPIMPLFAVLNTILYYI